MKFRNIIFDCDSTLTKIEGLDEIARRKGILNQVELITQQGMNGEIPYRVSFQKRWLEIVQPDKKDLEWLGEEYIRNLVDDAFEVVLKLMSMGRNVFILSHVPEVSINILAKSLGISAENVFAVPVKFSQDSFMSIPEAFLEVIEDFKVQVIKKVRTYGSTVLIGDGITDYMAGKEADLFIGFGGVTKRPKVKELSQFYIEVPRLQPVVDIVLYYKRRNMLDIKFIREHPNEVKENIKQRGVDENKADVDRLLVVDDERRKLTSEIQELRRQRTEAASERNIERGRKVKEELDLLEEKLKPVEKDWQAVMDWIPNMLSVDTPSGKDSGENVEIKAWHPALGDFPREHLGKAEYSGQFMPQSSFPLRDHVELGKTLDIIDLEQSAKVSGSRFSYLKKEASLLQFGLFELLKNKLLSEGFIPMIVPLLVRERVLYGTSHFPGDADQVYKIENKYTEENQDLFLVGSSEPPLFGYYMDRIVSEKDLPQKFFAYTSCFRSEVGSWGKDVRGIKRVHQFDKLEMDAITTPEKSGEMHEYLLSINEWFLRELKIPYHVILMCSGDAGYAATHKKYDIEVWLPSQKSYMEVMSDTNATDFQAHRFNIRYADSTGQKHLVHNVNDTGCAMGRMIIAILDNYQQEDGSVKIPEALKSYIGKDEIGK